MYNKNIKLFLNSSVGKELKDYIVDSINELKDIDNLEKYDTPTHQVIELKACKKAHDKLINILNRIMTFDEDVREKDTRDSYK